MRTSGTDGSLIADAVREAARSGEPDRYLACLLAPRAVRADLAALAAFSAELNRIVQIVTEPMAGEIRLQWWRDTLETMARGECVGHPLADALGDAMRRHHLPVSLVQRPIDARSVELGVEPAAEEQPLETYLDAAEGAVFGMALQVLGAPHRTDLDAVARAAGRAYGIARRPGRLLLALHSPEPSRLGPQASSAPAVSVDARAALAALRDEARAAMLTVRARLEPGYLPVLLPLVMVEPYLRAQERMADPLRDVADVMPLARVSRIWWAHVRGRI